MAVLGIFEAQVVVNGTPAHEYDDDENPTPHDAKSVTKYVEAVSGAFFEFKVNIDPDYHFTDEDGLAAYAYVDGHHGGWRSVKRRDFSTRDGAQLVVDGYGQTEKAGRIQYKLKFADLETREIPI